MKKKTETGRIALGTSSPRPRRPKQPSPFAPSAADRAPEANFAETSESLETELNEGDPRETASKMFEAIFGATFNPTKCKTQLRLCVSRIRLLQNKKTVTTRAQRKDIAKLLEAGKEDSARIRVEALIQEESTVLAYEMLELYCELLSVRVELMKQSKSLPEDMQESVASVLYAAQRCSAQLPELVVIRQQLQAKYGKEYAQRAQSDETCLAEQVNPRLVESLAIKVPPPKKKLALLSEIALEHGVDWEVVTEETAAEDVGEGAKAGAGADTLADGANPKYPDLAGATQYPNIQFTDEQGNEDDPPVSPAGSIAVGTPVHPGDAPAAAPQDFKKAGGAAAQDPMAPAPPSAPVLASAPPSGKPPASHSEGVPDLPDTPSPLHLNLNINVVDVDEGAAPGGVQGGGEGSGGGMDELSKRLDALKTGGQLPKPPKDF